MDYSVGDWVAVIDDEGDMATEKIVSFLHNKVLFVDTDGRRTEYPKIELNGFRLLACLKQKEAKANADTIISTKTTKL